MPTFTEPTHQPGGGRFVVLHHTGVAPPHYDLLVDEHPGRQLLTWRLPCWPIVAPAPATLLTPHRRVYLTYEGPISGDRGHVTRVATGEWQRLTLDIARRLARSDAVDPLHPPSAGYRLLLSGSGRVLLVPTSSPDHWEASPEA